MDIIVNAHRSVKDVKRDHQILNDYVKAFMARLKQVLQLAETAAKLQKLTLHEEMLQAALEAVEKSPLRGRLVDNIAEVAGGITPNAKLAEGFLQQKLYAQSVSVRLLMIQLVSVMSHIASQLRNTRVLSPLLHLIGTVLSLVQEKEKLLDATETARYIASLGPRDAPREEDADMMVLDYDEDDVNIWDEPELVKDEDPTKAGTINRLVSVLTSEETLGKTQTISPDAQTTNS